jgi:hypothetical protein
MVPNQLTIIAHNTNVPIIELSVQDMANLYAAPQAQKRTSKHKKTVKIVKDRIFKGPYAFDDPKLTINLTHAAALQLLESVLKLPQWRRGSLPWNSIECCQNSKCYLVAQNIGRWKSLPFEIVDSAIETGVKVVPRKTAVWRVSDMEGTKVLTAKIKSATLQHLYLRYLLDIGDSGTHHVLLRQDNPNTGRLIAGIDLEERRLAKDKNSRLAHLFKKGPSKKQTILYEPIINKVVSLSYSKLNQPTLASLDAVGIDLEKLKWNIERWSKLN